MEAPVETFSNNVNYAQEQADMLARNVAAVVIEAKEEEPWSAQKKKLQLLWVCPI